MRLFLLLKKNEYKYAFSYIRDNNINQGSLIALDKKDIWNNCEGITENDIIQNGN